MVRCINIRVNGITKNIFRVVLLSRHVHNILNDVFFSNMEVSTGRREQEKFSIV